MARGRQGGGVDVTAMEMTKWFDTNYHYIVPELRARHGASASPRASRSTQYEEAKELGHRDQAGADRPAHLPAAGQVRRRGVRPARAARRARRGLRRGARGARPARRRVGADRRAGAGRGPHARGARGARARLQAARRGRGRAEDPRQHLLRPRRRGVPGADAAAGRRHRRSTSCAASRTASWSREHGWPEDKTLFAGVVSAATCGSTTSAAASSCCDELRRHAGDDVVVSTSCSLQHSPIDKRNEPRLDDEVLSWMSFAVQKLDEVATLDARAQRGRGRGRPQTLEANRKALEDRERVAAHAQPAGARAPREGHRRRRAAAQSPFADAPRRAAPAARAAALPDHDDRLVPADRRDPPGAHARCATARSTRPSTST